MLREFEIAKLIPSEPEPRISTLRFYTTFWRKHKSLDIISYIDEPPIVKLFKGKSYIEGGNQRAIFYAINGFQTIIAEDDIRNTRYTPTEGEYYEHISLQRKIFSVFDLICMLPDPSVFRVV